MAVPVVGSAAEVRPTNQEIFAEMKALQEKLSFAFFGWDFQMQSSKLGLLLLWQRWGAYCSISRPVFCR